MVDYYIDGSIDTATGTGAIGTPYGRWGTFVTARQGSLSGVGVMNVYIKNKCVTGNNGNNFSFGTFSGANSTNYIHLQPWPGFEGTGTIASTPGFQRAGDSYVGFLAPMPFMRATRIAVYNTTTGVGGIRGIDCSDFSATGVILDGVLVRAEGLGYRLTMDGANQSYCRNCLAIVTGGNGFLEAGTGYNSGTPNEYMGCTAINLTSGGIGFATASHGQTVGKNNACYGSFTTEYSATGTWMAACTNNAGQIIGTSQPTNIQTLYKRLTADPFVNFAGGNYAPSSTGLLANAGANGVTTVDAVNTARGTPPEIGYLEATAGPSTYGHPVSGKLGVLLRGRLG